MKNNLPIIGLTPQLDITTSFRHVRLFPQYQRSLQKAGGIGIMLPLTDDLDVMKQMTEICDGFLFTGGQDLQPTLYGEKESEFLNTATGYAPERDAFESDFYPIVRETNKPILAICRGFQIINVLHGGSIEQELYTGEGDTRFIEHSPHNREGSIVHPVIVKDGTQLKDIFRSDIIYTNSFHHQGLKKMGNNLTISGTTADGLVEAFDIDGLDFGVAVQWHPEVLYDMDADDGLLFKAFIKACYIDRKKRLERMNSESLEYFHVLKDKAYAKTK